VRCLVTNRKWVRPRREEGKEGVLRVGITSGRGKRGGEKLFFRRVLSVVVAVLISLAARKRKGREKRERQPDRRGGGGKKRHYTFIKEGHALDNAGGHVSKKREKKKRTFTFNRPRKKKGGRGYYSNQVDCRKEPSRSERRGGRKKKATAFGWMPEKKGKKNLSNLQTIVEKRKGDPTVLS